MSFPDIASTNLAYGDNPLNIKIFGDQNKGAVIFHSERHSISPKFLGTLTINEFSGSSDTHPRITISRTDKLTLAGLPRIIIKKKPIWFFFKEDGTRVTTATDRATAVSEVIAYLNGQQIVEVATTTSDLTGETVGFSLDATSTSILFSAGHSYGVNTIKAVDGGDGTIHIKTKLGDRVLFSGLQAGNALDADDVVIPGGLGDVVNYLNELFTAGPFESVVISDPYSTMVADVSGTDAGYTLEGSTAVDPSGGDIFTNSGSGNYAGLKSTATIDQAGEYFTFDIRGEGQIGFGLIHTDASYAAGEYSGNAAYADPASFGVGNSAHYGWQFSHWFHPTPNGSWTNYGANTSYVMGSTAWWAGNWDQKQDWLDGNPVKIRCGLDTNGFISIESLQDDGSWVLHARTSYPVTEGSEFHLGIKAANSSPRVYSEPKVHLLAATAPTMYFRYIESPDGEFDYPLFTSEEEVEYYDQNHDGTTGSGTWTQVTYDDDPSATNWYKPDTGFTDAAVSAPSGTTFVGNPVVWTEITSLDNADLAPSAFSFPDYTYQEGTVVNLQLLPAGATFSQSVSISPASSGMVYNTATGYLQGTLADVGADTTYTVTVTRANTYGSTVATFDVTATDVAPPQTNDTPWTKALVFDGTSEYVKQSATNSSYNALRMGNKSGDISASAASAGETSGHTNARPWAATVVFKPDGDFSDEYIWSQGMGSGSNADNLYLRLDSVQTLWFGWGRGNNTNECRLLTNVSTSAWHGIYVGFRGTRLTASEATAANLADCFDIRWAYQTSTDVVLSATQLSASANWIDTGESMTQAMDGNFSVGGRTANRPFHGKVASMVVTTLKQSVAMPTTAEIELMIKDPVKWVDDYKVGNTYRSCGGAGTEPNFQIGSTAYRDTKVWLMGDGTNDSYANGMRNYIYPDDNAATRLIMWNMVSNDIENVTITGLS